MKQPESRPGSPGTVWVWMSWFSLLATVLFYFYMLHSGKGRDEATGVLILGGLLSLVLFLVALARAISKQRKVERTAYSSAKLSRADPETTPRPFVSGTTVRLALAGLLCIAMGAVILVSRHSWRVRQDTQCVAEAQASVEAYFRQNPHPKLGNFQSMGGEGYGYRRVLGAALRWHLGGSGLSSWG